MGIRIWNSNNNRSSRLGAFVPLLALAIGFAGTGPGIASAQDSAPSATPTIDGWLPVDMPDTAPPKPGVITDAQLEDLATMAEQDGISLKEAIDRYAWHEPFSMLVDDIRERYRDSFAGAMILPEGNPWIAFKSDVPRDVQVSVADFVAVAFGGAERVVDLVPDRGFTEAELNAKVVEAHYAAYQQTELVANVSSGYDIVTGEIIVEVEPLIPVAGQDGHVMFVAQVVGADEATFAGITVRVSDKVIGGDDVNMYGGHAQSSCTSGFSVKKGSLRGLATAGHCPDNLTYPIGSSNYGLTIQQSYEGSWGDFQWAVSIGYERDDFYSGSFETNLRDVYGTGFPDLGQTLCRNGKTTGKYCDTVYKMFECFNGSCGLTAMHHRYGQSGDSGGPWFYGGRAYGIHKGYKWMWFSYRDLFSPVSHIDEALGVTIATS